MIKQTLYEILGVDSKATQEEIKRAYREMSVKNHPDKLGDASKQAEINNAYEILSDEVRRERYDRTGDEKNTEYALKVQSFLQNIFFAIITQQEDNLIERMQQVIENMIVGVQKGIQEESLKVKKYNKIIGKLKTKGDNNLLILLKRQIDFLSKGINAQQEYADFMKEMLLVVADYEFEQEEKMSYCFYIGA